MQHVIPGTPQASQFQLVALAPSRGKPPDKKPSASEISWQPMVDKQLRHAKKIQTERAAGPCSKNRPSKSNLATKIRRFHLSLFLLFQLSRLHLLAEPPPNHRSPHLPIFNPMATAQHLPQLEARQPEKVPGEVFGIRFFEK